MEKSIQTRDISTKIPFRPINSESIFSKKNVLSLYRGCTNNCICCFNRSRCAGVKNFNEVGIKYKAPEILENALRHKRRKCMVTVSNLADPYQSIEKDVGLFRTLLEIISKKEFGINIRTKNDLIYRDFDLIEKINYDSKATVEITLNCTDDAIGQLLEPNAALVSRRFQIIKDLKYLDIPVIMRIKPILPLINDSKENLEFLINFALENHLDGILLDKMGVKLNNTTRDFFFENIKKRFPEIHDQYVELFGTQFNYESQNAQSLFELFHTKTEGKILADRREIFFFEKKYRNRKQGEQLRFF